MSQGITADEVKPGRGGDKESVKGQISAMCACHSDSCVQQTV